MVITGKVINQSMQETVPGANVFISDGSGILLNPPRGVATDVNGKYTIDVPEGTKYLTATFVGLKRKTQTIPVKTCSKSPCITGFDFILDMNESTSLQVVETVAKKPFNWKLWLGVTLMIIGSGYFIYSGLKFKKII